MFDLIAKVAGLCLFSFGTTAAMIVFVYNRSLRDADAQDLLKRSLIPLWGLHIPIIGLVMFIRIIIKGENRRDDS